MNKQVYSKWMGTTKKRFEFIFANILLWLQVQLVLEQMPGPQSNAPSIYSKITSQVLNRENTAIFTWVKGYPITDCQAF